MLALSGGAVWAAETNYVSDLDLRVSQGWGDPHRDLSVDGNPLSIGGHKYEHGLGTHAISIMRLGLDGKAESFTADVGVDGSESTDGSVTFTVMGDGKKLFESGIMHGGDAPKPVSIDLHGVKTLMLYVGDAGDGIDHDHADWADAKIVMTEGKPVVLDPEGQDTSALASKSDASSNPVPPPPIVVKEAPAPAIHGPQVFGVRPGNPFLFTIAATGDRPMTFTADGLPGGSARWTRKPATSPACSRKAANTASPCAPKMRSAAAEREIENHLRPADRPHARRWAGTVGIASAARSPPRK